MKKETKKETKKKTAVVGKKSSKIKIKKTISKVKSAKKIAKKMPKKSIKKEVIKVPVRRIRTVALKKHDHSDLVKKANFKISSEFAILVILIIAGTFTFVFWKGSSNEIFVENNPTMLSEIRSVNKNEIKNNSPEEKDRKIFRNEYEGNEFSLPLNWKIVEDEKVNKFISENNPEEIVIVVKENDDYSAEDLMEDILKRDKNANVKLLDSQKGILVEKRNDNILEQTAKIILGDKVVVATYSTYGSENSGFFLDEVVPTFKTIN